MSNPRWLLTFSHEQNSWMACNLGAVPWVRIPPDMARRLADKGYTIVDAI